MKLLSLMIPSKNDFNSTVNKILNSAEYKHLKNPIRDFTNKLKEKLNEVLRKWFMKNLSKLDNAAQISDAVSTVFIIIGLMTILAIVIIIIVKINKTFEKKNRIKEILGEKIDDKTTPGSLRKTAASYRSNGDLRNAIRYEFIALLLLMHEKSLVYLDETKTNEEILRYLNKNNFKASDTFKEISDIFNSVWYGNKTFNEEGYKHWSTTIEPLWRRVAEYEEH